MAYYYDSHDSRPQPSRRHAPSSSRDDYYSQSTANPVISGQARVAEANDGSQRYSSRYSYDPDYHYPPPPPRPAGLPHRPQRSPARQRQVWPPRPVCEDEVVSLKKEADSQQLLKSIRRDEVVSRGSIDQEPVIEDAPDYINIHEKRFVVVADSEKASATKGNPTPPTSEDERIRKIRRRPSKLRSEVEYGVPELSKKTSTPYAFSKPSILHRAASSVAQVLSPDTLTPPMIDASRRRPRLYSSSTPSSPRRDSVRVSRGNDYFSGAYNSNDNAIADEVWDTSDPPATSRATRDQPINASRRTDQPNSSSHTSIVDFAGPPLPGPPPPLARKLNVDARRNTDTSNATSSTAKLRVEKSRRTTPLMAASTWAGADDFAVSSAPVTPAGLYPPGSRDSSYHSSRAVSPASVKSAISSTLQAEPSPPRSPRLSADWSQYAAGGNSTTRSSSASGSRPSTPSPRVPGEAPRLPRTDQDWEPVLTANANRRTKPPSRLQSSMRQESVTDMPRAPTSAGPSRPHPSHSLPYPLDDGQSMPTMFMPSERGYQYFPPNKTVNGVTSLNDGKMASRVASPTLVDAPRPATSGGYIKPSLLSRHSVAGVSPTDERPRPETRKSFSVVSPQTKKELAALMKKGLPDCPRPLAMAGHDDWYTVIGAPSLIFCPDCVADVFERTIYRPSIRRLPQLNYESKVRCAFGSSPWLRLAWLLTLQQQRTDLALLKDIADIEESSEPCPGSHHAVRSWYGLPDIEGRFVRSFHICYSDVRKIERLLPTLSGFFERFPNRASSEKRMCAIRAEGNRFSTYMDALISTHERALVSRHGPDPMSFVALVERKTRLRECSRDNMLAGGLWHFIPSIPALTVCEDCYESVVEPEVKMNSDVAMRFNRTVQPVYGEEMGSSCQLYSKRMRSVFLRAVEDGDLKTLARKAIERREAELRLQERYKDVLRRAKRLEREGRDLEEGERRFDGELKRITEEWQARWE